MIPLLLVWLRAAGLVGQSVALGGAAFALIVLRPGRRGCPPGARDRTLALTAFGALLAAAAQAGGLLALAAALADDGGWPLAAVLGSTTGVAGLIRITMAAGAALASLALRRVPESRTRGVVLFVTTVLLAFTGALASHSAGRMGGRPWLVGLDALHHAAAGIWVGGLICAAVVVVRAKVHPGEGWLRPFSGLAASAVAVLALTGAALSIEFVAAPAAALGTSYGAMVLTKIALFAALLAMGALNYRALRAPLDSVDGPPSRSARATVLPVRAGSIVWPRRLEVEAGLAIVTVLLAASVGSAPPAVDVRAERATLDEVRRVFTPGWPRLTAPTLAELATASALGDAEAPHTAEDTAWSEFGHHVAGLFILAMGLLAMLERSGRAPWARHWPLLFVGLTGFVGWNMDPEGWQTGRVGFWEHLLGLEVLQHRILLALTALLGLAEWRVHSGRDPESRWRYVFPFVCIAAGALLLTHAHDVNDAKFAFMMEISHLPLALVILVAGWARWLELRLPAPENVVPGRLWAPALALFGLLLVLYREG
ncbi:MAG TPA: CopD family protein [Candidatus Methylomirabilis sp.]|nr:CopD family protein [Candidatus Methylomirabilis sp.]